MSWIQPLEMETWLINVFAGTSEIFVGIAILVIVGLSAFFRMTSLTLFFLLGLFLLMFSGFIEPSLLILMSIMGGLLLGYFISKMFYQ